MSDWHVVKKCWGGDVSCQLDSGVSLADFFQNLRHHSSLS